MEFLVILAALFVFYMVVATAIANRKRKKALREAAKDNPLLAKLVRNQTTNSGCGSFFAWIFIFFVLAVVGQTIFVMGLLGYKGQK